MKVVNVLSHKHGLEAILAGCEVHIALDCMVTGIWDFALEHSYEVVVPVPASSRVSFQKLGCQDLHGVCVFPVRLLPKAFLTPESRNTGGH